MAALIHDCRTTTTPGRERQNRIFSSVINKARRVEGGKKINESLAYCKKCFYLMKFESGRENIFMTINASGQRVDSRKD